MTDETLRQGIKARQFGRKVYTFETIDSTNNCAKALAGCFAQEGTVVFAEHQSAGRGRLGRAWEANPNENLMFSVILREQFAGRVVSLDGFESAVFGTDVPAGGATLSHQIAALLTYGRGDAFLVMSQVKINAPGYVAPIGGEERPGRAGPQTEFAAAAGAGKRCTGSSSASVT